jgi:hypothetical protein
VQPIVAVARGLKSLVPSHDDGPRALFERPAA